MQLLILANLFAATAAGTASTQGVVSLPPNAPPTYNEAMLASKSLR